MLLVTGRVILFRRRGFDFGREVGLGLGLRGEWPSCNDQGRSFPYERSPWDLHTNNTNNTSTSSVTTLVQYGVTELLCSYLHPTNYTWT